jgi:hypothetical protein
MNQKEKHRPDILFLSETLSKSHQLEKIRVLLKFDSCLTIDVEGRSGGLAILWNDTTKYKILNYCRNLSMWKWKMWKGVSGD